MSGPGTVLGSLELITFTWLHQSWHESAKASVAYAPVVRLLLLCHKSSGSVVSVWLD